ncbi:WD40 repeat domain-containing serine/threonine protein kinase [Actinomadura sediminis]|uniref:WD40 repeat domain-containing serine/threonine protein kinase n=1 Tax=Actinomadura sediminis TaxID=1038904 RepID=A0ABW3EMT8_9ACTN
MPAGRAAELGAQVADALGAAHRVGVVHRDVKPANLFLLDDGRVKVCDFGIARLSDATKITATGASAGTPLYMAPEQIRGEPVDHRTDLYAFGCVLYELLTGATWVEAGSNVGAVLYQHLEKPPAPPRTLRPDVPGHLDALVLELLAKLPGDRPPDAASVAGRLRGPEPRTRAVRPADTATTPHGDTARMPAADRAPLDPRATVPTSAPVPVGRRTVLLAGLGAAVLVGVTTALLLEEGPPETFPTFNDYDDHIASVAFRPDGRYLATASGSRVRLWETATGRESDVSFNGPVGARVEAVAFSPDGRLLAAAAGDRVQVWNASTGRRVADLEGHIGTVSEVAFAPDGRTIATSGSDQSARLWDVAAARATAVLTGHRGSVSGVAFAPDGRTLATGSRDGTVRLWDVATRRTTATLDDDVDAVLAVAFSPDGRTLAAGDNAGPVRLWDVARRRVAGTLDGHEGAVWSVAFSRDGRRLATGGGDGWVRVWDVPARRETARNGRGGAIFKTVAFSPDGKTLAMGNSDGDDPTSSLTLWKLS